MRFILLGLGLFVLPFAETRRMLNLPPRQNLNFKVISSARCRVPSVSFRRLISISSSLVVSVSWSGADRAMKDLKEGDIVTLSPTDGSKSFAGAVCSMQNVDSRQRIQMLVNARAAARMNIGQSLHLFVPGTGPPVPTGRSGIPTFGK